MRRSGKTSLLWQEVAQQLEASAERSWLPMLSLEDERLRTRDFATRAAGTPGGPAGTVKQRRPSAGDFTQQQTAPGRMATTGGLEQRSGMAAGVSRIS